MFQDYYTILCIDFSASTDEIKKAYRQQSIKWHPDCNPNRDVKDIMQAINEAYAILKDPKKKARYDMEYMRFKNIISQNVNPNPQHDSVTSQKSSSASSNKQNSSEYDYSYAYDYNIQDEELKSDIEAARRYARELVEQFLQSFVKSSKSAVVEGGKTALKYFIIYIAVGLILALLSIIF